VPPDIEPSVSLGASPLTACALHWRPHRQRAVRREGSHSDTVDAQQSKECTAHLGQPGGGVSAS
jgi:hypothetical protein